ncbi:DDX56 [Cordylochernes scorpioides]|uniref:DDX56 n=1 Tax=Cordylochernes scorpioides TaxID=51811 RepID=A0ABY6K8F9_9ARAC|nr:DDX56 [Cordylochernes scorpioides]
MELMSYDLHYLLFERGCEFQIGHKRNIFMSICRGLDYLHSNNIVHRDIKLENILVNNLDEVKICDFGLAIDKKRNKGPYDRFVGNLTHAAPEVLFGEISYDTSVDLWALGIILSRMFEVILYRVYPKTTFDQLYTISTIFGTLPFELYSSILQLKPIERITTAMGPRKLHSYITNADQDAKELIENLLQYDPTKRPTARKCLDSTFLSGEIRPLLI